MKKNFYKSTFRFFFICILALCKSSTFAQDSSRIRISLLTCTPGDELYSIFGHSAIRIIDSANSIYQNNDTLYSDIVYNYGTFNFDDEGFYIKFVRGKLNYYISIERFEDFKYLYQATNRGMTEQVLNFSETEKINIRHALVENLKEENKYYQYDFFFDNCTTRLRDLIVKSKDPTPLLPAVRPLDMRFRQAIHEYLDKGDQQWSKLGIDILLGAPTDRIMKAPEQQFLPDNLMMALDSCVNLPLVASSQHLYPIDNTPKKKEWFTPLFFFSALLIAFIAVHIFFKRNLPVMLSGLDGILFFSTGLLGFLLIFMWLATDHSMTKNNYNLLWALPSHFFISFFINSTKPWIRKYFGFTALAGILLLVCWFFLPQQMNIALIPLVVLIIFRAAVRYLKIN